MLRDFFYLNSVFIFSCFHIHRSTGIGVELLVVCMAVRQDDFGKTRRIVIGVSHIKTRVVNRLFFHDNLPLNLVFSFFRFIFTINKYTCNFIRKIKNTKNTIQI